LETLPLSGLEFLGLVRPQKPRLAVPTLRDAEAAGDSTDLDPYQQLLSETAGGDSLHNVPLPDVPRHYVPHPEARPDG